MKRRKKIVPSLALCMYICLSFNLPIIVNIFAHGIGGFVAAV